MDLFSGRVEGCSFAEDEFHASGGIWSQTRLYGLQDLFIFEDAGDNGAYGSYVPVKMGILQKYKRVY